VPQALRGRAKFHASQDFLCQSPYIFFLLSLLRWNNLSYLAEQFNACPGSKSRCLTRISFTANNPVSCYKQNKCLNVDDPQGL